MVQEVLNHWIYPDHDHQHTHYIRLDLVNSKEVEGDLRKQKKGLINTE